MSLGFTQYKAVLKKNFMIHYRNRQFLTQLATVLVFVALILVINHFEKGNPLIVFYMTLTITSYSRGLANSWVAEKQSKQKQLQKIMGINPMVYNLAWFTYFLLNGIYITIIFVLPLQFFGLFADQKLQFGPVFGLYLLYMLSTFCFILFLCSFFRSANIAAQGTMFIQIMTSCLFFLIYSEKISDSSYIINFLSIFPALSYDFSFLKSGMVLYTGPIDYTFSKGLIFLTFDAIFYLILFLYFGQIIPNQYGTHRKPLFFLEWIWKPLMKQKQKQKIMELQIREDLSSARFHQKIQQTNLPTVQIEQVSKLFNQLKAVDDITLTLYQSQIFCLLGHNGAGKSTLINILTGMLIKDSGNITINGMKDQQDLQQIRKSIGLCLQQDVLYDMLTVEDHISYYATIKGVPSQSLKGQIDMMIQKCALQNQVGKYAKNLSGGNKRKLSLANALVGGSKIIFLDEPSSGLDPNSRQSIWQILEKFKNQKRTIVLTTHHLQQAQHLAQRIGIMAKGKLLILGDCNYIKNKFGVGYHLFITFDEKIVNRRDECIQLLGKLMPGIKQDTQSAGNVLKYILPLSKKKQFAQLFKHLQQKGYEISLKMCSLQDAFVNIGMNDDFIEGHTKQIPQLPIISAPKDVIPSYSFKTQFNAVFIKKVTFTFRSFSTVISIILPVIFMLVGLALVLMPSSYGDYVKFYLLSYFMIWAFIFNTSAYCGGIVFQREKKFKYLSNVMGLRKFPYWIANFVFDLLIFIIPIIVFFIIVAIFHQKTQFILQKLNYMIPVFFIFAFAFIAYSYTFSFVFQNSSTAYKFFPFINLLIFYLLPSIPSIMIPHSVLAKYIMPLTSPFLAFANTFQSSQMVGVSDSPYFFNAASIYYLYGCMIIQFIFYTCLTLLLQSIRFSLRDRNMIQHSDLVFQNEDQGVAKQLSKVANNDTLKPIIVDNLYKKYGNGYLAIRNNTFIVEEGQLFGLLGPNGAGKSTTFNILTAAISKTDGSVKINNTEINHGIMQIFQEVGICPQFDALYDNLTVREHLSYFARIKGQQKQNLKQLIYYYLQVMQLVQYADIQAGRLSGGNKRKLCVSMAMIGNPQLMFFDQPSSGVDPIARRFLWQTLNSSLKQTKSSIVLTTHSMQEAESLCHRIGILVKGRFVCLGSPLELKKKYGNGYRVTVKLKDMNELIILRKLVSENYAQYKQLIDQNLKIVAFQISAKGFKFSKAFQLFQKQCVQKNLIEEFQIAEASLQQVFLFFSKLQPPPQDTMNLKEPWQFCCCEFGAQGCILKN